jgi:hypothetical protein
MVDTVNSVHVDMHRGAVSGWLAWLVAAQHAGPE